MPATASGGASLELVSGPDLGGGFLHQLTVERLGAVQKFIFHAQEGGMDANGPPKGSPVPFGWRPSSTMCPIGGRLCWHREFAVPLSDALLVRNAYNRTRFVMEAMIAQEYGGIPVPFDAAFETVADALNGAEPRIPWFVGGRMALRVQGANVEPREIQLGTTPEGVARIATTLQEFATEPAAPTEWDGRPVLAARAFVGTLRAGARVGWAIPTDERESHRLSEWTILSNGVTPVSIDWHGRPIPVAPPEATLLGLTELGGTGSLEGLESWLVERPADRPLLERLVHASTLSATQRTEFLGRY
ncbi:MAG: hypothetical protein L3K18_09305 [Thermoplasmata archaeon]|nr:hypothetical protein [Thermoplasmata archaeon]